MPSNGNNDTRSKAPNYNKTANTNGTVREVFARRMKEERIKQGLTQQELADLAQVSLKTVKRYEKGTKAMQLEVACDIADALDISIQYLLPLRKRDVKKILNEMKAMISSLCEQFENL